MLKPIRHNLSSLQLKQESIDLEVIELKIIEQEAIDFETIEKEANKMMKNVQSINPNQ